MTHGDECARSCYELVAKLNEEHNVYAVQHKYSKNIYVEKILTVYNTAVFEYLKNNHIKGTPEIVEAIENNGTLIVIEEYISGRTLRNILDEYRTLPESRCVDIVLELCTILQRLHGCSPAIIHRDIKPSNIIITPDGDVKLIDLNAAKYSQSGGTQDTVLLGTVGYAAPEQYGFAVSDVRADIYSLGVLLGEMLSGKFSATGKMGKIISKCTRMDPKDRYNSVGELADDLKLLCCNVAAAEDYSCKSYRKYLPPGFRTGDASHIVAGVISYCVIFLFGFTLTIQGEVSDTQLWIERTCFILCCLSNVFFSANYLNVWHLLKIDRIKNRFFRIIAVMTSDFIILLILFTIMFITEKFVL